MPAEIVDIRKYALVEINGETLLACHSKGTWTIDSTCQSINLMLKTGVLREESVQGWVERRVLRRG